jgi:hypothetical protein
MTRRWKGVAGLLLLVPVVLLAGCAAGGAYQGAATGASSNDVPPAFRNVDPALRHWYEAPYFNPYEMP